MKEEDLRYLLSKFETISEFRDFMHEQINDGAEISRGKDENDESKEEKQEEEESKEAPAAAPAEGGEGGLEPPAAPLIDPSQAPGSQIAIGKKEKDISIDPDSVKIKLSKKQEKLDMSPTVTLNDPGMGR